MTPVAGHKSPRLAGLLIGLVLFAASVPTFGQTDGGANFEKANQLYEQGRFTDAAVAYESLLRTAGRSAAVHYNLASALFKAGRTGDAIAHYLEASRLAPRDRDVRANLAFARGRLPSATTRLDAWWEIPLAALTLDEWSILAFVAIWIWAMLFATQRLLKQKGAFLRSYTVVSGAAAALLALALGFAAWRQFKRPVGVVVVRDAAVRNGPLDESKTAQSLPEGTEVRLLERKSGWLLIRTARSASAGWVHDSSVHIVGS